MKLIRIQLLGLFLLLGNLSKAQLHGVVKNTDNEALAYATVYIEGTSIGASTNVNGQYSITPDKSGTLTLICQYLGYETKAIEINYTKKKEVSFVLAEESIIAPTVEIRADAEDPAYAIIRQAIKKRKYHLEKIESMSYGSYIKGRFDVEKVPRMMLDVMIDGNNIFDVDSNGQGIVYLSESESTFYKDAPDKVKEVMHSSLVSGFDNQFSFNNALSMDFSIYGNQLNLIRDIISPIGSSALLYYKYRLLGTTTDEKGRLLNKILLIPKSKTSPTFSGVIYVLEDLWSVPQAELILNSDHAQEALIDSIRLVYSSVEVEKDTWVDIQKNMWMRIKAFGFAASGGFNGVFHNFNINPEYDDKFFDRELFKVEAGANKKSETYWDSIRPLPLTDAEAVNYVAMDSLQLIREKELDSLVNNPAKFKLGDILNGYSRYYDRGAYQMRYYAIDQGGFNVVQGYFLGLAANLQTNADSFHKPAWRMQVNADYGFSEKEFRGSLFYSRSSNKPNQLTWSVEGGRFIQQYRQDEPLHALANTFYSLFEEKNYAKYFEQLTFGVEVDKQWLNGISVRSFAEVGRRHALVNNTDYSWSKSKYSYESNNPRSPNSFTPAFQDNTHLVFGIEADFVIGQKYISLPNRTFKMGSKYPDFQFGILFDQNFKRKEQFVHLKAGASDSYDWNVAGSGGWNMTIGGFLLDKPSDFIDYKHFDGNQTIFGAPENYLKSFHLLPYYSNSTNDYYIEAHYEHKFQGFILDKVPLIRLLKWNLASGVNFLYTPEQKSYSELYLGVENIGISFFRFLRADVVLNFDENGHLKTDYMIGLNLSGFGSFGGNKRKRIKTNF